MNGTGFLTQSIMRNTLSKHDKVKEFAVKYLLNLHGYPVDIELRTQCATTTILCKGEFFASVSVEYAGLNISIKTISADTVFINLLKGLDL